MRPMTARVSTALKATTKQRRAMPPKTPPTKTAIDPTKSRRASALSNKAMQTHQVSIQGQPPALAPQFKK